MADRGIISGLTETATNGCLNGIICDTVGLNVQVQQSLYRQFIAGHSQTQTSTNFGSNEIISDPVGGMATQKQQHLNHQPTLYHQLGSMANLQSFLMGNSNLQQPFNNDQVMAMKASALSGLLPRNENLNNSVASLENNDTASNLNNLMALSNGSASSLMANSHSSKPFSDQIMATMASSRPRAAPDTARGHYDPPRGAR